MGILSLPGKAGSSPRYSLSPLTGKGGLGGARGLLGPHISLAPSKSIHNWQVAGSARKGPSHRAATGVGPTGLQVLLRPLHNDTCMTGQMNPVAGGQIS